MKGFPEILRVVAERLEQNGGDSKEIIQLLRGGALKRKSKNAKIKEGEEEMRRWAREKVKKFFDGR